MLEELEVAYHGLKCNNSVSKRERDERVPANVCANIDDEAALGQVCDHARLSRLPKARHSDGAAHNVNIGSFHLVIDSDEEGAIRNGRHHLAALRGNVGTFLLSLRATIVSQHSLAVPNRVVVGEVATLNRITQLGQLIRLRPMQVI